MLYNTIPSDTKKYLCEKSKYIYIQNDVSKEIKKGILNSIQVFFIINIVCLVYNIQEIYISHNVTWINSIEINSPFYICYISLGIQFHSDGMKVICIVTRKKLFDVKAFISFDAFYLLWKISKNYLRHLIKVLFHNLKDIFDVYNMYYLWRVHKF